jgi:hypothetical protein
MQENARLKFSMIDLSMIQWKMQVLFKKRFVWKKVRQISFCPRA